MSVLAGGRRAALLEVAGRTAHAGRGESLAGRSKALAGRGHVRHAGEVGGRAAGEARDAVGAGGRRERREAAGGGGEREAIGRHGWHAVGAGRGKWEWWHGRHAAIRDSARYSFKHWSEPVGIFPGEEMGGGG